MDYVQSPQHYGPTNYVQYDPRQYDFASKLGESSHTRDNPADDVEPAKSIYFTPLALRR
jgi:hypothetical protein